MLYACGYCQCIPRCMVNLLHDGRYDYSYADDFHVSNPVVVNIINRQGDRDRNVQEGEEGIDKQIHAVIHHHNTVPSVAVSHTHTYTHTHTCTCTHTHTHSHTHTHIQIHIHIDMRTHTHTHTHTHYELHVYHDLYAINIQYALPRVYSITRSKKSYIFV